MLHPKTQSLVPLPAFAVLGRPGGDRLSRVLRRSTMGAEGFDGRVRNGIGFGPLAWATRPAKHSAARGAARQSGVGSGQSGGQAPPRSADCRLPTAGFALVFPLHVGLRRTGID